MAADPARLFLWTGLVWHGALRAYWVALVVRITVELELPSLQLVLLGTAMEGALLLSEVPTGVVADTISRKLSIVIGFVGIGLAQIAAGLAASFPLLVATQVLWGIAYTFRSGADTAWITDELGGAGAVEQLVLRRARLQLAVSIVSIGAGAGLGHLVGLQTTVVLTGLVLIATGATAARIMPETGFERSGTALGSLRRATSELGTTLTTGARTAWSSPALRVVVVVLVLEGLGSEAVDRLDIRRLDQLGLSAQTSEVLVVGAIGAAEAAIGAVVLWRAQAMLAGRRVVTGLAVMVLVSAFGVAVLGLIAVLPVAAAGLMVQGGLRTAAAPLHVNWVNAHAPSRVRATVHSFAEQSASVGEVLGGVVLGAVAAATTVPTAMAVSVVVMMVAAGVAMTGRRTWAPIEPGSDAAPVR